MMQEVIHAGGEHRPLHPRDRGLDLADLQVRKGHADQVALPGGELRRQGRDAVQQACLLQRKQRRQRVDDEVAVVEGRPPGQEHRPGLDLRRSGRRREGLALHTRHRRQVLGSVPRLADRGVVERTVRADQAAEAWEPPALADRTQRRHVDRQRRGDVERPGGGLGAGQGPDRRADRGVMLGRESHARLARREPLAQVRRQHGRQVASFDDRAQEQRRGHAPLGACRAGSVYFLICPARYLRMPSPYGGRRPSIGAMSFFSCWNTALRWLNSRKPS